MAGSAELRKIRSHHVPGRRHVYILTRLLYVLALMAIIGAVVASLTRPLPPSQNSVAPFWTGTWSAAADSLVSHRSRHTATLLPSGQVLIAGDDTTLNAPAELYDPETDSWTAAPPMYTGRYGHTATLLDNGEVLVVGGRTASDRQDQALQSAEIYNPDTMRWTNLANAMPVPRDGHTSTLLENGKVLITGGHETNRVASLYDPETQTWAAAGEMNISRRNHTATRLADGRVLVVGGETRDDTTGRDITGDSAEIYDPSTNSWVNAQTAMLGERKAHVAALLPDGNVLVAGGTDNSGGRVASAELYDPESDTWSRTIWMTTNRADFLATTLDDGRVFVTGGCASPCRASVEFYDPQIHAWKRAQDMNTTRRFHTATLLTDGRMLIVGGTCDCPDESNDLMPVELLAPAPILQFPWSTSTDDSSSIWYLSDGPHCNSDAIRCGPDVVRYAISFMPPRLPGEDGCAPERQTQGWITAAAGGEVRYASDNLVEIHHEYGYRTGYYHVTDFQVSRGDHVSAGQKLGRPSCESSDKFTVKASEVQLRFYTCQKTDSPEVSQDFCGPVDAGAYARPIDGLLLSGWSVNTRSSNHEGTMVRIGDKSRRATSQQCGIDDNCQTNSGKPIRNDLPQQLLSNASFEMNRSGDGNVKGWPGAAFTQSNDIPARSGRFSGQFDTTIKPNIAISQVVSDVTAGNTYIFQGWINIRPTTDAFTFTIRIRWRDATNTSIRTDVVSEMTTDTAGLWNKVGSSTATLDAPVGATNAVVMMRVQGLSGEVYVDDFLFHTK